MHSSGTYFSTKWEGTSSTSPIKMLTREPVPREHQPEFTAILSPCTATELCEAQLLLEVAKLSAQFFPVWSKPIRKQNKTKNTTTKKPKTTESHRFSCPSCKIQRRKGRKVSSNCLWNAVWSSKTLHFFLLRRFFWWNSLAKLSYIQIISAEPSRRFWWKTSRWKFRQTLLCLVYFWRHMLTIRWNEQIFLLHRIFLSLQNIRKKQTCKSHKEILHRWVLHKLS